VAAAASGKPGCAVATEQELLVLLGALMSDVEAVRDAGLRGLKSLSGAFPDDHESIYADIVRRTCVAKFDPVAENRTLAEDLWDEAGFEAHDGLCSELIADVIHPVSCVRSAAAEALASLLETRRAETSVILACLLETYEDKLEMAPPVLDNLGRVVEKSIDHWEPRSGIALALSKIAAYFDVAMVETVASFLVPGGLGDRDAIHQFSRIILNSDS
jgi:hypothetical protein